MAAPNLDDLSEELTSLLQFCGRLGKQPFIKDPTTGLLTASWAGVEGKWAGHEGYLTFAEARKFLEDAAKVRVNIDGKWVDRPITGIGFMNMRAADPARQIVGGDIDCCRNPDTGNIGKWAYSFLHRIQTFYVEVSPSKTGIRFFALGHLPNDVDSVTGHGAQDDLPASDREAILAAKPGAREKIAKGKPAFNGIELYVDSRHLTLTGDKLATYCCPPEDCTAAIAEALRDYLVDPADEQPIQKKKSTKKAGSFPPLNILQVIDTTGFEERSGQLSGSHPTEGSTTGANLVVNPGKGVWAYMHDKPAGSAPGGDAWVWLACECGAVPWEEAGPGVLKDPVVVAKTMMHAAKRGLIPETDDIVAAFRRSVVEQTPAGLTSEEILVKVTSDMGCLSDSAILHALAEMKANKPAAYDLMVDAIRKAHKGLRASTIRKQVDAYRVESKNATSPKIISASCHTGDAANENGLASNAGVENYPKIQDLTKAIGRMDKINPDTGIEEPEPMTEDGKVPKLTLSPTKASYAVTAFMPLRTSTGDTRENMKLWRCDGKIWTDDGEREVKNLIDAVIGDLSYEKGLHETLRRIRGISETVTFDSNPFLFPALDKVIDLKTGVVRDYQPDDYITYQYGAAVEDPSADYRPVLWALCSSAQDPGDVLTALDIATAACIRQPLDAIVQLIGPGANGKGIFERMLTALCTISRVAAITLTEAKASRFGPGAVLGKDIWILSEVEDVKYAINLLKKVATGEFTDSDVKYGDRIQGKPHVLPILDCNTAIDFGDDSWGRKRRIIKLDYPHTFDYIPGTRRKDPHLEEKVTSPSALAGLLQIIAARAPFLCESRRIYTRKRPEQMDAEYKRQQFSLAYFCEECLTTTMPATGAGQAINVLTGMLFPNGEIPRLTTEALLDEYKEYCELFNVPVPAEKNQIGKYINKKFNIQSIGTTEHKKQLRYYPGLWLSQSAKLTYGEFSLNYSNYSTTTAKLQEGEGKNDISRPETTATTGEWPKEVIEEIRKMFDYIQSCQNPQDISYEGYLENAVVPVVAVVSGQQIAIPEKPPVVLPSLPCSSEGDSVVRKESCTIEAELLRAEEQRREKEVHEREQAAKYAKKQPKSYSELARSVPSDTSSPEAEKICRAARGLLMKGMAPRIDFLVSDTGLPETTIQAYMDNAPWVRKDDSSPAGIVVYLPSEAPA